MVSQFYHQHKKLKCQVLQIKNPTAPHSPTFHFPAKYNLLAAPLVTIYDFILCGNDCTNVNVYIIDITV